VADEVGEQFLQRRQPPGAEDAGAGVPGSGARSGSIVGDMRPDGEVDVAVA
jgi:hypothetical protein